MVPYLVAWIGLLVVAVLNGALRQFTFGKHLPELRAHQWSTLTGSIFIGLAVWLVVRVRPPHSAAHALQIGALWSLLTVTFETFMGRVISRRSWAEVVADYDLRAGRVWVLFLVWLTVAPCFFYQLTARAP